MGLNKQSAIPLYHQLECALREAIESGQWQSGQQLPNEDKLAGSFGVSKITVRQALQQLAHQGYIRREQGRGTFVSMPTFGKGPRELTSFSEEVRRHRLIATSRVLEQAAAKATDRVAEALGIRPGEAVFRLKRLRMANGEPMAIQTAHIPLALAPGVAGETFENSSLYDLLQSRYGLQPLRARETYHADAAEPAVANCWEFCPARRCSRSNGLLFCRAARPSSLFKA